MKHPNRTKNISTSRHLRCSQRYLAICWVFWSIYHNLGFVCFPLHAYRNSLFFLGSCTKFFRIMLNQAQVSPNRELNQPISLMLAGTLQHSHFCGFWLLWKGEILSTETLSKGYYFSSCSGAILFLTFGQYIVEALKTIFCIHDLNADKATQLFGFGLLCKSIGREIGIIPYRRTVNRRKMMFR